MPDYDTDHEDSEEENEGWGPSLYNNGKGIKMTLLFTPLIAPLEPGKKRRANAKPPVMTRIDHFHEDVPLRDFLIKALTSLKREDLFECSWLFQGQELDDADSFSLSYTIPRRVTDQVVVVNEKDYKQMVEEASNKSPFEVKLYVVENKTGNGDDNSEEEAEHEEATGSRKKQKTSLPSKEETAQAKIIQELERRHRCEDRQCGKTPCYVAGANAEHIHLTHMHLRTWAAAIVDGKIEGVDQENPPNAKMFDPTNKHNIDDVALLAKRRLAQNRDAVAPAITVNFPGFADVFRAPNAPPLAPVNPATAAPANSPRHRVPPPPMKLDSFCHRYELSEEIRGKLDAIQIAGPHVLRLISDTDLRGEGRLSIGELASVRDAQLRWTHALANPA
ncbi:hypothetical protein BDZ97DRAFT_1915991 [Flammula alnicola]|nr:hypothetical protein BDZ97DRAFT_1923480 [Flammula alnicola]KAF8968540.1 hypothetical protein BDZ97DRAFT_1915991 [Flammula alnicola]